MFELIQNTHLDQSVVFAGILQDSFQKHAQRASRNVRQAGFLVLRETAMPGVLIETGYLSNQSEAGYLMTDSGRETIALSIFNSFKSYKEKFESRLNLASGSESKKESREVSDDNVQDQQPSELNDHNVTTQNDVKEKKNQPKINKIKETKSKPNEPVKITFAIQLSASDKKLSLNSKRFKGIENISEIKTGGYYKYYCLENKSLSKAKQNLATIRIKIPDAFIAAFKNGKPIPWKEAMQLR